MLTLLNRAAIQLFLAARIQFLLAWGQKSRKNIAVLRCTSKQVALHWVFLVGILCACVFGCGVFFSAGSEHTAHERQLEKTLDPVCALQTTKNNLSCTFRTGKSASPSYSCQDTEAGVDALGFGWFARHSTFTNCPNLSVTQVWKRIYSWNPHFSF